MSTDDADNLHELKGLDLFQVLDRVYPVGSEYRNYTDERDPSIILGFGIWEQIEDKFILAAGSTYPIGTSGGAETHNHGLSTAWARIWVSDSSGRVFFNEKAGVTSWSNTTATASSTPFTSSTSIPNGTTLAGTTNSSSNLPPYTTCYIWKRIA